MKEYMNKYLQIGIVHFMAYPQAMNWKDQGNIVETVRKIVLDDYFDAIEITHIEKEEDRLAIKKLLDSSHMKVCYGAQPRLLTAGLNPNALNETERLKAEAILIDSVDEAEFLGASGIAFLAGKYEEETKDEAFQQLLKTTKNVCDYASEKNMTITLEVFDYDLDKKSLIGPAPYAAEFAAQMRHKVNNFGLMMDLSHIPQTHETSKYAIQVTKPYITHFHIGNGVIEEGAEAFGDTHPRFGFPNSVNDVAELLDFLRVLKEENFLNSDNPPVLSFEVKPWLDEDADVVVANAKRTLNRAWSLL
ncbi:TIM barrel protein [Bacillus sp. B15-48]|uniref:sugar phosphate isomerase/epimerase family protein n=1 Tax=Bacillus sp. B15-48 TaxID=1548601 RepID=UPI00193ED13B|nr:TIM barrel protein [Bacillus sp. B15-48]MBM4761333.1 TIM barrel protein [Bacillus sp. B15-48]